MMSLLEIAPRELVLVAPVMTPRFCLIGVLRGSPVTPLNTKCASLAGISQNTSRPWVCLAGLVCSIYRPQTALFSLTLFPLGSMSLISLILRKICSTSMLNRRFLETPEVFYPKGCSETQAFRATSLLVGRRIIVYGAQSPVIQR